jgi:lysophospholipase L1-like esterase
MRLLLVADSHGRGMGSVIHRLNTDWTVMTVRVSSQTSAVRERYVQRLAEIRQYEPEAIILHVGHNDLSHHEYYNPTPKHVKDFFPSVLEFVRLLQGNHPSARVFYSSVFPRSTGPTMSDKERRSYNKLASRFGALTQSTCTKEEIRFMLNGVLWISVRQAKENPDFFLDDGLHLCKGGQEIVAREWISTVANTAVRHWHYFLGSMI